MIRVILILGVTILLYSTPAFCDKTPERRVIIVNTDTSYIIAHASTFTKSKRKHLKDDLCYYWYRRNNIFNTFGNFSGAILDGEYTEYDLKGNLLSKGFYNQGLKHDKWYFWVHGGTFLRTVSYKKGKLTGLSIHYSNQGNPIYKAFYKDGILTGISTKYIDGIIATKTKYRKGRINKIKYYEYGRKYRVVRYTKFGELRKEIPKKKETENKPTHQETEDEDISTGKSSKIKRWISQLNKKTRK